MTIKTTPKSEDHNKTKVIVRNEGKLPPPAGSREEAVETARIVGYSPGIGSCIIREE